MACIIINFAFLTQPEHRDKSNQEISVMIGLFQVSLQSTSVLAAAARVLVIRQTKQVFNGGFSVKPFGAACCPKAGVSWSYQLGLGCSAWSFVTAHTLFSCVICCCCMTRGVSVHGMSLYMSDIL